MATGNPVPVWAPWLLPAPWTVLVSVRVCMCVCTCDSAGLTAVLLLRLPHPLEF